MVRHGRESLGQLIEELDGFAIIGFGGLALPHVIENHCTHVRQSGELRLVALVRRIGGRESSRASAVPFRKDSSASAGWSRSLESLAREMWVLTSSSP